MCQTACVTCHMSHVLCHVSCFTCHMSNFKFQFYYIFYVYYYPHLVSTKHILFSGIFKSLQNEYNLLLFNNNQANINFFHMLHFLSFVIYQSQKDPMGLFPSLCQFIHNLLQSTSLPKLKLVRRVGGNKRLRVFCPTWVGMESLNLSSKPL